MNYSDCDDCLAYMERRHDVLLPEMAKTCDRTGEESVDVLHRYMTGVHDRHMSGLSLAVLA